MNHCPECPNFYTPIEGDGPLPSPILALGERPGARENQYGRVFCGPTGEEANYTYFPLARLQRGVDFRVENCVRCWALSNRTPTDKEVASCAGHFLPNVIEQCQPELLILMGGSAHRIVDRKEGERKLRVDVMHGRPFYGSILGGLWEGWMWSSYHPALGMHDTPKMGDLIDDFVHLGEWRRGEWEPPVAAVAAVGLKDYGLILRQTDLVAFLRDGMDYQSNSSGGVPRIYTDTERHGPEPWSIQFSLRPHSARMLRFTRGDSQSASLFEEFARWIHHTRAEVVLHNADQDMDVMERMYPGLGYPALFSDTMVDAYNLCSLPQALKTLAYRLLGVTMRSWEDVVWPASVDAWMSWAVDAIDLVATNLTNVHTTYMKTYSCDACGHRAHQGKKCASKAGGRTEKCGCVESSGFSNAKFERRPAALEKVLRHVLRHTAKDEDDDEPYNPWKKLPVMLEEGLRGEVPEKWEWEWVVEQLGPSPILGIGNCDLQEAADYGNSDADHTGQVAMKLEERRGDSMWRVDREDYDQ